MLYCCCLINYECNDVAIKWKLRSVMSDRKMSATNLAQLMGVNRVTVSGWANSDGIPPFRNPSVVLNQLCKLLSCTPSELIVYIEDDVDK